MDDVYEAAVKRADDLTVELKELNNFIELYRATRQRLGLDARKQDENIDGVQPVQRAPAKRRVRAKKPPGKRVTDNPPSAAVASESIEILKAAGRPMERGRLHKALADRGMVVRGVDPLKTLATILWRSERFRHVEGQGYWLRDEPQTEANSAPEAKDLFFPNS